ncbi:MAG: DUF4412 domain-containing protein [Chitinophagaceae bacterium]|jgi:hypothetical protein|nr:DUF4412 domain-containing protein [Chitinophagaceae bacterium]
MVVTRGRRRAYTGVLTACFLFCAAFTGWAQLAAPQDGKIISEGILHYKVHLETAETGLKKLFDSTIQIIYLKGNQVRIEFTNPLRTQITLFRAASSSGGVYKISGTETYYTPLDSAGYAAYHRPFEPVLLQPTGDTATISGFFCQKYDGKSATGLPITIWVDKGLTLFTTRFHPFFSSTGGLPVQYSYLSGNERAVFTLLKAEITPVNQNIFEVTAQNVRTIEYKNGN